MLDEITTVTEALDHPQTAQFTRIPIYAEDADNITGKVIKLDLFEAERAGHGADPISKYTRKIVRISEKLPVQQLLDMFIKQHMHLFLVEDEFGQPSGVVTLEDAIETLLGREIVDESDVVEDLQELARDKYRDRLRQDRQKQDLTDEDS